MSPYVKIMVTPPPSSQIVLQHYKHRKQTDTISSSVDENVSKKWTLTKTN